MMRIVGESDPPDAQHLGAQIDAICVEAAASNPLVFFAAWETPDGTMHMRALPFSNAVIRGVVDTMYDTIHADTE
jgi:hypothetical protein